MARGLLKGAQENRGSMKSNLDIQHSVQHELEWDPRVDAAHIGVTAQSGVVTLSGRVSSYAEKVAAERAAKRVYGVHAVADELVVGLPGGEVRTDEDIGAACVAALKHHTLIPPDRIKVTVDGGRIALDGEVDWRYQKLAAEKAVRFLRGVTGVRNAIIVKPRVSPSDVKNKIEQALKRSAELDARRISVLADGSKITLLGAVRSWIEKDEAVQTAWAAPGVDYVDDQLVVS